MKYLLAGLICSGSTAAMAATLSPVSYGRVTFGDRLESVEKKLRERAPAVEDSDENHCRQIEFKAYPRMIFMVENGVVTRVETSSRVETTLGFTVGASFKAIKKATPSVSIEPHQYEPNGHYLTFSMPDGRAAILMEELDGKVTQVRAGLIPSVQYVEGCL